MARIAAFLASFFSSIFGLVAGWMGKKVGVGIAFAALFVAAFAAFYSGMKALTVNLVMAVPYEPFVMGFWACWPSNAETCITAMLSADVIALVYRYKLRMAATLAQL